MPNPELYDNTGATSPQSLVSVQDVADKAAASGYASLDATTKVPTAQLGGAGADATKFLRGDQAWAVPAGGGSTVLFDSTLGANAASIDTGANGIAQTSMMLDIWLLLRTTQAVALSSGLFRINGDSGANYDQENLQATSATVAAAASVAQTSQILSVLGASAAASAFTAIRIWIPAYTQTTAHKSMTCFVADADATAGNNVVQVRSTRWRNTAAINQLSITAGSGSLLAGSRMYVVGV